MLPQPPQTGGMSFSVFDDLKLTLGHFVLLGLILLCVYSSRVPPHVLAYFARTHIQIAGLLIIVWITKTYGWIHGIIGALAYILLVSAALRTKTQEPMVDYVPAVVFSDGTTTSVVPNDKRWFVEKVLGENPFLIREREVNTSAVQDFSEKGMGSVTSQK